MDSIGFGAMTKVDGRDETPLINYRNKCECSERRKYDKSFPHLSFDIVSVLFSILS